MYRLRNFYKREQSEFVVTNTELAWDARGSSESLAVLPVMRTDVSLQSKRRNIIMDCKFYREALSGYHGSDKIHSANLYQLYAYLRNAQQKPGWANSDGILLYPAVGDEFSYTFELDGHPVCVASVNLDRSWKDIHNRLIVLLEPHEI